MHECSSPIKCQMKAQQEVMKISVRSEETRLLGKACTCFARNPAEVKATFHLTISMRGQRVTSKIQRNNYHHGSCEPSLTDKTMSVFLIFTQGTHRNVKNR